MSYEITNIDRSFSIGGIMGLLSNKAGYCIHPITYKNIKYIVDFELVLNHPVAIETKQFTEIMKDICVLARIYPYREKPNIFFGKKGKRLYETDITRIILGDSEKTIEEDMIDLRQIKMDDLKIHLPKIMQIIFFRWEKDKAASVVKQAAVKTAEAWDGIVQ